MRDELREALARGRDALHAPRVGARALWRWRDGVSLAVDGARAARKLSEDIAVPVDRLAEAIERDASRSARATTSRPARGATPATATCTRPSCSTPATRRSAPRADDGGRRSCSRSRCALGGTVTGEHGIGLLKNGQLSRQWAPAAVAAHRAIKAALDPKGLFNPGKKLP